LFGEIKLTVREGFSMRAAAPSLRESKRRGSRARSSSSKCRAFTRLLLAHQLVKQLMGECFMWLPRHHLSGLPAVVRCDRENLSVDFVGSRVGPANLMWIAWVIGNSPCKKGCEARRSITQWLATLLNAARTVCGLPYARARARPICASNPTHGLSTSDNIAANRTPEYPDYPSNNCARQKG
jgi:hypothetical protein